MDTLALRARRSPAGTRASAAIVVHRRSARRAAVLAGLTAALFGVRCDRSLTPPRIVYPSPWLKPALGQVAQQAIDAWGRPVVAELPESLMRRVKPAPGYEGDIDYAEAMIVVPGLAAAVGPQSSRATLLVGPIYAERGIPLIVATATSDRIRALGPWVFQLAPDNAAEGAFIARFVLDRLAARRVTVFYLDADEYGLGLRDGVVEALRASGTAPVDQVAFIESADLPRRVAESLRRAAPDVVVVAARAPEALVIARAVHERLPRVAVVAGDGVPLNADFIRAAGTAASSVYAVAWWSADSADPQAREFASRFAQKSGAPPSPAETMYYDAIMVAAQAIRTVGPRPAAVRRYLSELGTARAPYHGVTGPISFAPTRPVNLLMTRVVDGAAVPVNGVEATR